MIQNEDRWGSSKWGLIKIEKLIFIFFNPTLDNISLFCLHLILALLNCFVYKCCKFNGYLPPCSQDYRCWHWPLGKTHINQLFIRKPLLECQIKELFFNVLRLDWLDAYDYTDKCIDCLLNVSTSDLSSCFYVKVKM